MPRRFRHRLSRSRGTLKHLRLRLRLRVRSVIGHLRRQRVVHLLHIRKTGGTALQNALRRCAVPSGVRVISHPHGIHLADIPRGDEVVFVLRDPLSRFVSGFNGRLREGSPAHSSPMTRAEKRAFRHFATPDELGLGLSAEDPAVRAEAEFAMRHIRHVQTGLDLWLGSPQLVRDRADSILMAGSVETLEADFETLKTVLELPADCSLPRDAAKAHRAPGTQPAALSDAAAANLRRWYRKDYELIEACRDLETLRRAAQASPARP
jgi:hypothetical protein